MAVEHDTAWVSSWIGREQKQWGADHFPNPESSIEAYNGRSFWLSRESGNISTFVMRMVHDFDSSR